MEFGDEESATPEPVSKRHKKHKKKHRHRKGSDSANMGSSGHMQSLLVSPKPSIKLKLKIGKETMATKSVLSVVQGPAVDSVEVKSLKKTPGAGDDDEISDEEKWLDALEQGKLDTYGELAKKDPALLTARQKALLHGSQQDQLLQLPSGYKTVELTDEQKQRRQEKAKRRRQQANEKMENDKNQTVHKLLKKQDSKNKRVGKHRGGKSSNAPRIIYKNSQDKITIHLPSDMAFPLASQTHRAYPMPQRCGVKGCPNMKTSVCSTTQVPICGLRCYKSNLAHWRKTTTGQDPSLSVVSTLAQEVT